MAVTVEGRIRVASVGDNCMDRYVGALVAEAVGGNALNVAVRMHRLGYESAYLGAVGDDEDGRVILAALQEAGVDTSQVMVVPGFSGVTVVEVSQGERRFLSEEYGVAATYRVTHEAVQYLRGCAWVHAARLVHPSREMGELRSAGARLSWDFTDSWNDELVAAYCPYLDVAFFSGAELTAG